MKKYSNLVIEYARGAMPTLILKDETGADMETLAIDKWDTEEVREYLDSQVQM